MRLMMSIAAVAALAACSQEAPRAPATTETPPATAAALALSPLVGEETRGRLGGELGCSFAIGRDVYVLAMGNVDPTATAEALVKRNGVVVQMPAAAAGGYDGLVEGETFADEGLSVEVRTNARNETGTEEVAYNATLTARDATGERAYEGTWTCGP